MKVCARCGLAQDADAYTPSAVTYDGLSAQCMRCVGGRQRPQRKARRPGGHRRLTVDERQARQAARAARVELPCVWCGTAYQRTPQGIRRYCSRACYDAATRQRNVARARAQARDVVGQRQCACGVVFDVLHQHRGQVSCSRSCGQRLHQQRARVGRACPVYAVACACGQRKVTRRPVESWTCDACKAQRQTLQPVRLYACDECGGASASRQPSARYCSRSCSKRAEHRRAHQRRLVAA